jgi:[protein-PII] uridylyltransferase
MDQPLIPAPPFFDPVQLREELTSYWREAGEGNVELRGRVLNRLKLLRKSARDDAARLLERTGDGRACAAALSHFQDELIKLVYDFATHHVYRAQNPSEAERMAILATGGYGRGLLAPGSDVDLLFLLPYKQTAWGESVVEYMLYILWDLGFKVGHATRTIDQCLRSARTDMTTRTTILDSRLIYGDAGLFREMWSRFVTSVVQGSQREFIAAKLDERETRLKRTGISRYRVEPNIKEGKGGLRDLNMLHWFAAYLHPDVREGGATPEERIFTPNEYATYRRCEAFLWTIRCHLHYLAGKSEERLSFDLQAAMAEKLGYRDRGGLLGVERFMKHYFLVAKDVGDLTRIVCASLELHQLKPVPGLDRLVSAMPWSSRARLSAASDFKIDNGRLNVKRADVFRMDPLNLIRLFVEAERHSLMLHPEAIRLARASLKLIDDKLRTNREANRLFLELLTSGKNAEATLRAMNEAGVLGRFIPEFGRVVAMAQFNMYHHYTIDEHLIRAIGILAEIEKGALSNELPLSTEIIGDIQNRRALYVALLTHDVAKGLEEDHSVVGARIARTLSRRLGLSASEAETAAWLVEHHLVMSQFAQSRDISDPKTISDFANIVQSPERLKLLLLLTVADIRAVGPGIWNGWKGQLLRSLYYETEPMLAGGHTKTARAHRIHAAEQALREALDGWPGPDIDAFIARQYPAYWLKTDLERQVQHAHLLRRSQAEKLPLASEIRSDSFRALTELTLVTRDNPRLLMLFAGACAAAGANIASAQITTTRDGFALDTISLQRAFQDDGEEIDRAQRIAKAIGEVLAGKRTLESLSASRPRPKPRLEAFTVPPEVVIDNTLSDELTVIEVQALDRPGLLFDVSAELARHGLDVSSAHIATFGERAVDVFYITDRRRHKVTDDSSKRRIRQALLEMLERTAG